MHTTVLWHGEDLDRLTDAAHAQLVGEVARRFAVLGWTASIEVTFQIFGERGSIDLLAAHQASGSVVVIEVKSVVPDLQAMLATLDRKVRLAPRILEERGLPRPTGAVSRLLVLPSSSTTYRRAAQFRALETALPARTLEVRRWLIHPNGTLQGIWFVPPVPSPGSRKQLRVPE